MHIAFNGWFWDQPNTGSGEYISNLIPHLRKLDSSLKLTLILPPHNPTPANIPDGVEVVTTKGMKGKLGKVLFEQRTYPNMVKKVGADIAHVPYWAPPLSSPAKLVTSILDMIPVVIPDYSSGFTNRLYTSLVSSASAGSAHTITISHAAKQDIVDYLDLPEDSITVTHLGVAEHFHPRIGAENDEAIRQKYNLPEQFVLYLGSFDFRKQVNQLLYAYTYVVEAEGDQYPLVLAGKRPPQWKKPIFPDLDAYIKELKLDDLVQWTGFIPPEDKAALYRLADVFVFPSMYEGFGLPPLEAMASGTPVVTSNIDVFQEVLGEGAFLAEAVRNIGGGMLALLNQQPFYDTMVNQGLAQATRYTWRKTAQNTHEVYEKVLRA